MKRSILFVIRYLDVRYNIISLGQKIQFLASFFTHSFGIVKNQQAFCDYLRGLDCSDIEVYAISEGSVVFPKVPLLRIEGPVAVSFWSLSLLTLIIVMISFWSLLCFFLRLCNCWKLRFSISSITHLWLLLMQQDIGLLPENLSFCLSLVREELRFSPTNMFRLRCWGFVCYISDMYCYRDLMAQ